MSDIIYILLCNNFSSYAFIYNTKIIKIQNYGFDHIYRSFGNDTKKYLQW